MVRTWRVKHLLAGTAAVAIGAGLGVRVSMARPAKPVAVTATPRLDLRSGVPYLLDLGVVPPGGAATGRLTLRNPTTGPIRVAAVELSCDCVRAELTGLTVAANGEAEVTVALDFVHDPTFRGGLRGSILLRDASGAMIGEIVPLATVTDTGPRLTGP